MVVLGMVVLGMVVLGTVGVPKKTADWAHILLRGKTKSTITRVVAGGGDFVVRFAKTFLVPLLL
jgi:hypothetical protein